MTTGAPYPRLVGDIGGTLPVSAGSEREAGITAIDAFAVRRPGRPERRRRRYLAAHGPAQRLESRRIGIAAPVGATSSR